MVKVSPPILRALFLASHAAHQQALAVSSCRSQPKVSAMQPQLAVTDCGCMHKTEFIFLQHDDHHDRPLQCRQTHCEAHCDIQSCPDRQNCEVMPVHYWYLHDFTLSTCTSHVEVQLWCMCTEPTLNTECYWLSSSALSYAWPIELTVGCTRLIIPDSYRQRTSLQASVPIKVYGQAIGTRNVWCECHFVSAAA